MDSLQVKSMAEYATKEEMRECKRPVSRTYVKREDDKFKAGARVDGDLNRSLIAARAQAGLKVTDWGATIGAGAECHFFQVKFTNQIEVSSRILGADAVAYVGVDLEGFVKEGSVMGAEARARATLGEFKAGPLHAHFGLGVSAAAKVEDGALELRFFGCGLTVGKKIGLSVFDNNVSVALAGKEGLWQLVGKKELSQTTTQD
ncbi:uncharacterized protein LOC114966735 [Acropora millepora]|uniref:uncharacterized protein LOC114966735 n=1 Tax=Acropora millepora TaxID=45264 RepID=UPI0010FC9F4F|nr:uncharacterized protein LOC114966735 [Acropora millepora]